MKLKFLTLLATLLPMAAFAEEAPKLDSGDTAWMIVATAFVMLMTPAGLALFYGGMTRSKNVLNTMGMSLIAFAVGTLVWVLAGYSIAFGEGDFIGTGKILLDGITDKSLSGTIPELLFVAFQGTFAAIAVAIASGSMIERVKFSTFTIFVALWILVVYAPVTHWAWGGGTTLNFGEMDFAGGTVVHINAGVAGFVVAMMLGKRKDYGKSAIKPFSPVFAVLGAALLWFGWFGFNAGSEVAADGVAGNAFLVTNVAASLGVIGWLAAEWIVYKTPTLIGGASGAVAGLVAITPASGSAGVTGAIIIGLIFGLVSSPCASAPLVAIITIAQESGWLYSYTLVFSFALGHASFLLLAGLSLGFTQSVLSNRWIGHISTLVNWIFRVLLIGIGLYFFYKAYLIF